MSHRNSIPEHLAAHFTSIHRSPDVGRPILSVCLPPVKSP